MENNEGNLYCQIIFLNFGGEMEAGWFRVNDEKKNRISHLLKQFLTQFLKFNLKLQ